LNTAAGTHAIRRVGIRYPFFLARVSARLRVQDARFNIEGEQLIWDDFAYATCEAADSADGREDGRPCCRRFMR
jgi:hypothetical protein